MMTMSLKHRYLILTNREVDNLIDFLTKVVMKSLWKGTKRDKLTFSIVLSSTKS